MSKYRVAVLGVGSRGSDHLRAFEANSDRFEVVALADIPELAGVHGKDDGTLVIGAMTTLEALVNDPAIAEHAFAMLLALTRGLPFYLHPDQRGQWVRDSDGWEPITLHDRTLFVVGLGGIGREVAKRGHGFEMHVLATRRLGRDAIDLAQSRIVPALDAVDVEPLLPAHLALEAGKDVRDLGLGDLILPGHGNPVVVVPDRHQYGCAQHADCVDRFPEQPLGTTGVADRTEGDLGAFSGAGIEVVQGVQFACMARLISAILSAVACQGV